MCFDMVNSGGGFMGVGVDMSAKDDNTFGLMSVGLVLVMLCLVFGMFFFVSVLDGGAKECSMSRYNTYSNSTTGYMQLFGDCYVEVDVWYMSTEDCEFLVFGCRTVPEYSKYTKEVVCFRLSDGRRC